MRPGFQSLVKQAHSAVAAIDLLGERVAEDRRALAQQRRVVEEQINDHFTQLERTMKDRREELLTQCRDWATQKAARLDTQKEQLKGLATEINGARKELETMLSGTNAIRVLMTSVPSDLLRAVQDRTAFAEDTSVVMFAHSGNSTVASGDLLAHVRAYGRLVTRAHAGTDLAGGAAVDSAPLPSTAPPERSGTATHSQSVHFDVHRSASTHRHASESALASTPQMQPVGLPGMGAAAVTRTGQASGQAHRSVSASVTLASSCQQGAPTAAAGLSPQLRRLEQTSVSTQAQGLSVTQTPVVSGPAPGMHTQQRIPQKGPSSVPAAMPHTRHASAQPTTPETVVAYSRPSISQQSQAARIASAPLPAATGAQAANSVFASTSSPPSQPPAWAPPSTFVVHQQLTFPGSARSHSEGGPPASASHHTRRSGGGLDIGQRSQQAPASTPKKKTDESVKRPDASQLPSPFFPVGPASSGKTVSGTIVMETPMRLPVPTRGADQQGPRQEVAPQLPAPKQTTQTPLMAASTARGSNQSPASAPHLPAFSKSTEACVAQAATAAAATVAQAATAAAAKSRQAVPERCVCNHVWYLLVCIVCAL
jgi:hypothetical protein